VEVAVRIFVVSRICKGLVMPRWVGEDGNAGQIS
jgi:hypothetical protein